MDAEHVSLITRLTQRLAELEAENLDLKTQNLDLKRRLDELERAANRQAAPFRRRDSLKKEPGEKKRPGRPKGHKGETRPIPKHIDDHAEVKLEGCPKCGGTVADVRPIERYIEEIVPVQPKVTKVVTYTGTCAKCGEVHSAHPLQTAPGPGGSRVQIGPRALATAAMLNKQLGLTMRKTCRVLITLLGLGISPGGLAQALQRAATKVEPDYLKLIDEVRRSPAVFVDETSWWVGSPKFWLWTFTTPNTTVYTVDQSRGSHVVTEILGADFRGILVSDCLSTYDSPAYRKHKCIAHHLKAIKTAEERPDTTDLSYLKEWKTVFLMVCIIWRHRSQIPSEEFAMNRVKLQESVDRLLAQPLSQRGDISIQKRLLKQRDHLLGCLSDPSAEPTNNRAERSLRPAVIARKLSCGNKTENGKHCWELLVSLGETCHQRGENFVDWLTNKLVPAIAG